MLIPDKFHSIFGFINTWKPSHKYIILHYLSVWNVGWFSYHVGCIVNREGGLPCNTKWAMCWHSMTWSQIVLQKYKWADFNFTCHSIWDLFTILKIDFLTKHQLHVSSLYHMPQPPIPALASYCCSICGHKCLSVSSLTCHKKLMHPKVLPPKEAFQYKWIHHPYLTGIFSIYNIPWLFSQISLG